MSTTSAYLKVAGIDVDVVYKDIKHIHIGVYPPLGRVRVAAPLRLNDNLVRVAVAKRLRWIRTQRLQLRDASRQTERQMVSGESHYIWGVRYRLRVLEHPERSSHVEFDGHRLVLCTVPGTGTARRLAVYDQWRRAQLRERIGALIAEWAPVVGKEPSRWTIRRMKTKWGSCNPTSGHIWFNVELISKHPEQLEYLVVHEMVHLLERGHGERFTRVMDELLPSWRSRRDALNAAPLAHEDFVTAAPQKPSA